MSTTKKDIAEYWRLTVDRAIKAVIHDYLMSNHAGMLGRATEEVAAIRHAGGEPDHFDSNQFSKAVRDVGWTSGYFQGKLKDYVKRQAEEGKPGEGPKEE